MRENFNLWVKGNEINKAEIWKLQEGLYEVKRRNKYADGYQTPVFFVWDQREDRQILSTLNYQEAYSAWEETINSSRE